MAAHVEPIQGRGALGNPGNRFERLHVVPDPDGDVPPEERLAPRTVLMRDATRRLIVGNDSPDVRFDASINPYRGCEHGCVYCYARPTHEYLGFSAGLDFETRILVKEDAPALLRREIGHPRYRPAVLGLSGVTDPYQPIERTLRLTRGCLEVLAEHRHPVTVITKAHLVTRDADLLSNLARHHAASVMVSVTTLDADLAGTMEPRAARPERRLDAIRVLAGAGVPTGVLVAPLIPGLTDHELPAILNAAARAGARCAGYVALRLPHGTKDLFLEWLDVHQPMRRRRVEARLRELHGGDLYDSSYHARQTGRGVLAEQIASLFQVACRKAGIPAEGPVPTIAAFRRPGGEQRGLFDAVSSDRSEVAGPGGVGETESIRRAGACPPPGPDSVGHGVRPSAPPARAASRSVS